MATIEIDGKTIEVKDGQSIIDVADRVGIHIPRFCYHKRLSVAANCRMCLIEVERSPKLLPACATPTVDGMKVHTKSEKVITAQKSVMEYLLINHPLDCPICDQGGECELQDVSLTYGADRSCYQETKRSVYDKDLGPLIATEMTRCIQCTRCVRFGTEISGMRELGALGRGEDTEIGTFIEKSVESEISGNIIDLCPVGALTSKPYRFSARSWEMQQHPSLSPHDSFGSHLNVHVRRNKVMRIVPRECDLLNESWISDRDRFSYEALSVDRLAWPKLKKNDRWESLPWDTVLPLLVKQLGKYIPEVGGIISPSATLEEHYLFQHWLRGLGSQNIDHRIMQLDFRDQDLAPLYPTLGSTVSVLKTLPALLCIGCDFRAQEPLLALKIRQMVSSGGKLFSLSPKDPLWNVKTELNSVVPAGEFVVHIAQILKTMTESGHKQSFYAAVNELPRNALYEELAHTFHAVDNPLVLVGEYVIQHPQYTDIVCMLEEICEVSGARLGFVHQGSNAAGAWIAGSVPHRMPGGFPVEDPGYSMDRMLSDPMPAYILFNVEPAFDFVHAQKWLKTLSESELVIAFSSFESPDLDQVADIILPITPFTENAGTLINLEGKWQTFKACVKPFEDSRSGREILTEICQLSDLDSIPINDAEIKDACLKLYSSTTSKPKRKDRLKINTSKTVLKIGSHPMYRIDPLTRRAPALQKKSGEFSVHLNSRMAKEADLKGSHITLKAQGHTLTFPYSIDESIADNTLWVPMSYVESNALGESYSPVEIIKE